MIEYLTKVGPIIAGLLYLTTGIAYSVKGCPGWAIMWFSYALANVGIIIAASGE